MTTFQGTWKRGLRIAREATWGTAPGDGNYNEGGKWFSALTTSPPGSLRQVGGNIIPTGQVAKRNQHQYAPVPGGRHGEGTLDIPFTSDLGGLLLVATLGAVTSTPTEDAGNPLMAAAEIATSPQALAITDPTAGAVLKFTVAGSDSGSGTVEVTGTTPNGATVTETVQLSGNGEFYTRHSFATVTSATLTHTLTGTTPTIQVDGVASVEHKITGADSQPSLAIEEFGDPGAGDGNSWIWAGQLVQQLGIAYDATQEDGLLVITPQLHGKAKVPRVAGTLQQPVHVPFPAWAVSVTRDGQAYARVQQMALTIATGSRAVRASANSRDPQGPFYGARAITGQVTVAVENDDEWTDFDQRLPRALEFTFAPPYKLTTTQNQQLVLDMAETYMTEAPESGDNDGLATLTYSFYARENAGGILVATLTNGVASYA